MAQPVKEMALHQVSVQSVFERDSTSAAVVFCVREIPQIDMKIRPVVEYVPKRKLIESDLPKIGLFDGTNDVGVSLDGENKGIISCPLGMEAAPGTRHEAAFPGAAIHQTIMIGSVGGEAINHDLDGLACFPGPQRLCGHGVLTRQESILCIDVG